MTKCKYFGKCGGCQLQHLDYSVQVNNKVARLRNLISSEIKVFSDIEYGYRNRMDFIFGSSGLGLRNERNNIIPIDECPIANSGINILLKDLQSILPVEHYNPFKKNGSFRYTILRSTRKETSITFVLNENSTKLGEAIEKIKNYSKVSCANNINIAYMSKDEINPEYSFEVKGSMFIKEQLLEEDFFFPAQGFFQNNTVMAEKMQLYCKSLLNKYDKNNTLLDLYGGVGTFGIINKDFKVFVVENYRPAVEACKKNIELHNIENLEVFQMMSKSIKKLKIKNNLYVIANPPRSGMDMKTIQALKELQPESIIYISCNPVQLAKDVKKFENKYKLKNAAMFDLFPQTKHFEAIVELVKKE